MNVAEAYQELAAAHPPPGAGVEMRLAPKCPLDLFAFAEKPSNRLGFRVLLPAPALERDLPSLRGLTITRLNQPEGASLVLSTTSEAYNDVFVNLVTDLAAQAEQETEAATGIAALLNRLARWQTFLKNMPPDGLGPEAQRRLYGELWMLRHHVLPKGTAGEAVKTWTGPLRTDKDFRLSGGSVEVKTSLVGSNEKLEIHGERQLDDAGLPLLLLAHLLLEEGDVRGETLTEMIRTVRLHMDSEFAAGQALEDLLREAGYFDAHAAKYQARRYLVRDFSLFHVHSGFPRITAASLPLGVGNVTYRITLSACEPYRTDKVHLQKLWRNAHE